MSFATLRLFVWLICANLKFSGLIDLCHTKIYQKNVPSPNFFLLPLKKFPLPFLHTALDIFRFAVFFVGLLIVRLLSECVWLTKF